MNRSKQNDLIEIVQLIVNGNGTLHILLQLKLDLDDIL